MYFCVVKYINYLVFIQMKKDSTALKTYFSGLSKGESMFITEKIVAGCKVPRTTVYNWRYGNCRIPELYKDKIEEIVGEKIFDSLNLDEND